MTKSSPKRRKLDGCAMCGDGRGAVAVEFVFVFPILCAMLGLVMMAGQGLEISRKVTMTAHTLTDLASQQANLCAGATAAPCASAGTSTTYTYSQILNAAALVISPYDPGALTMTLSEIQVTSSTSGTVIWSQAYKRGPALTTGSTVDLTGNLPVSDYVIQGTVTYTFSPLSTFYVSMPITLSDTVVLLPRVASSIPCCN